MALLRSLEFVKEEQVLIAEFSRELAVLSSAIYIGRGTSTKHVIFKQVHKEGSLDHPVRYASSILEKLGIDNAVVFLTGARVDEYVHRTLDSPYESHVVMTVGLDPPACIELNKLYPSVKVSTINILVATDAPLSSVGMADLFRVVTEAKVLASNDLMLRCGSRPTGTVTDAVAVLSPHNEKGLLTAGLATNLGNAIARMVYEGLVELGKERLGIDGFLRNLVGLKPKELVSLALRVYRKAPIPGIAEEDVRRILHRHLDRLLRDPNIWALLIAARELDLHAASGSIPRLSPEEFKQDSVSVLADELIGIALALYAAGARGLFSMYWVERLKSSALPEVQSLPMFEDDVVSALIGSVITLLYDEVFRG